ncbi:MAG TPA: TetR/AcrR family transcriptional regulator [Polyangiaceae bacterium]
MEDVSSGGSPSNGGAEATDAQPPSRPANRGPATRDTRRFAQQRAHDTHRALLAAAAQLFAERGFDDTQTPDVARAAGVSVGTFYRYFADKRQAFIELMMQRTQEMYERVISNLVPEVFNATQSPEARWTATEHVVDVLFQTTAENPALFQVFMSMSLRDTEVLRIREEFEERGRRAIELLLEQVAPAERIDDARAAAEVIHIAAQEIALVALGCRGVKPHANAARLRSALAEMLYRYVFGEISAPR